MKPESSKKSGLRINEIFYSIQGESTYAGKACVFVRLTYCNLRCSYCDTEYAFFNGDWREIDDIIKEVTSYNCNLVEITGGEPLLQKNVHTLMRKLADKGFEVLIETAGHMDISPIDARVKRIMDIKCPSSNESDKMLWENIAHLKKNDEVKFVIGNLEDYNFVKDTIEKYKLNEICTILVSPVHGTIELEELARLVLQDHLPVRFQLQLHKYIWSPQTRGV